MLAYFNLNLNLCYNDEVYPTSTGYLSEYSRSSFCRGVSYFSRIGIKGIDLSNLYAASPTMAVTGEQIKLSLNSSTHPLFIILVMLSALCLVLSMVIPKEATDQQTA